MHAELKHLRHFMVLMLLAVATALVPLQALAMGFAFWQANAAAPFSTPAQQAYLKQSTNQFPQAYYHQAQFGYSVTVDGDTMAVGAPYEDSNATGIDGTQDNNSALNSGAVYVFTRSGSVWSQQAYIKASNTGANDQFGWVVSISGDTLAIGATWEDSNGTGVNSATEGNNSIGNSGAVYVFTRSGSVWSQQAYIKSSNPGASDEFGTSLSISGDTLAVSAAFEDSNGTGVNSATQGDNSASASGAVYVFTRSGAVWSQQAYIKASNTQASDQFGTSVSVSGDTLAVGAHLEDSNGTGVNSATEADNSASASGAVYVFTRSAGVWSQQAYVKASNTGPSDYFGASVSVSGDTLAVGASDEDSNGTGVNSATQGDNSASASGAVYVFTRSGAVWSQQAYIKASNTQAGDQFGKSVSVSGDTLAVGAPGEDSSGTGVNSATQGDNSASASGSVYVFTRTGSVWSQQAYIKASNTGANDQFGKAVSVSSDTLAIGAELETSSGTGVNSATQGDDSALYAGAVYVFTRSGTVWSQQAYVKSSNTTFQNSISTSSRFGYALSVSGETLAVGAPYEDSNGTGVNSATEADNSASASGAVYVFTRSGTVWSQQAYIKASNTDLGDLFGSSLSLSGDTLAVGASGEDSNGTGVNGAAQANNAASASGAVYVFTRAGVTWSQQAYIKASNTQGGDLFGRSVSVSGDTLAVGADGEDSNGTGVNSATEANNSLSDPGAVYVFTRSGVTWSQQAYIKASNTGADDWFGYSVSVSGDTLAVGAHQEDSNGTGVNSAAEADNSRSSSGAVYVFTRSGVNWSQQAYIKASTTDSFDYFGKTVSLSGETLAVGADGEDSNGTGVNSATQANNSAPSSGAVYVFTRSGAVWSQQAYIKASNTETSDSFGQAISLSGDILAVAAPFEDSNGTGVNSATQADNSAAESGAVYLFTRSGGAWSQQAYIKASNTSSGDRIGYSVSVAGNILAVGGEWEDSNGTGVNSATQADNSSMDSGAVYVFTW